MKKKPRTRNPMARDLMTPKYRTRIVESKRGRTGRKAKHKGQED